MKTIIATIAAILLAGSITPFVSAEGVPDWVKNNAGWWADGTISEVEFVSAIEFLIAEGILSVPPTAVSVDKAQQGVPEWVKNNAGWWAEGTISDNEFLNGIQHLIKIGMISVPSSQSAPQESTSNDSKLAAMEAQLEQCSEIKKAYQRLDCEKAAKAEITKYHYEQNAVAYQVGPIKYYYEGPHFEVMESGQPLLTIKMLAVNTGSDNVSLMCSGPAVCNYDVSDGSKIFKYSSTDFTSGNITLKPDQFREFEIMFGPNIGYGGTTFEYDSEKDYVFRINEPFGSASIPVGLG